jgi:two-component system, cell cycle sensor histidine kinase and response regulator CckA
MLQSDPPMLAGSAAHQAGIAKSHGGSQKSDLDPEIEPSISRGRASMEASGDNSITVIVVEDEQAILDMVVQILQAGGYEVLPARSGEEALQVAERHDGRIDLVLTDIVMPGMSGGEFIRRLESLKSGFRVLYMSGYTKYTVVNHGILESVSSFIWKPFSPTELLAKVREVLDSRGGTS